ncbi:MAG: hypothetical protein J4215_01720 [Candidatus Diapherotrites archaeon]|uniref:Uncharacterized protein n=1 Tax=Candidatus Iainarchaeum sp. TaxID=3101447 RepID=A0A8T4L3B9_9ARCH|nr:hypothetical protein [Candidatus Diapherotrites archaeon]
MSKPSQPKSAHGAFLRRGHVHSRRLRGVSPTRKSDYVIPIPFNGRKNNRKKKVIPPEIRQRIIELAREKTNPKSTLTGLVRQILWDLQSQIIKPRLGPDSVRRVLEEHAQTTDYKLPAKTAFGGKRTFNGKS